jgi:DNA-directed RNA polymerase specialized sigma24 family protein
MNRRVLMATLPPPRQDISTPPPGVLQPEPERSIRPTSPGTTPASTSLQDLLRTCRLAPQDLEPLAELTRRFEPLIRRIGTGWGRQGDDLDDLLQEARIAFVRAARAFDERKSRSFVHFARRRINWALRSACAARARARAVESSQPLTVARCPAPLGDLGTVLMRATGLVRIDLTQAQRRVLEMTVVDGLSVRECADELGLPLEKVRKTRTRAIARIRRALALPKDHPNRERNLSHK